MSGTATTSNLVHVTVKGPLRCEGPGRLQWGEDPSSSARVAVRFLPLTANGEAAVHSLRRLPSHPTLPKVLQVGRAETEAFAVLDFPQGRLLGSTLEKPLELRRVLKMGRDLADALAAAHAEGIAHGELSAQSVLLLGNDDALLWDLPLVFVDRMADRRGEGRTLQKLEWTAEFLAPERACGQPATAAADVWALAALMCRTAGSPRPMAPSTLGVVHLIASRQWAPRIPERLAPRIKALLQGMLSNEPSERLTAVQVRDELGAILLEVTTLQDLPAVDLESIRMPSTGEDGDLVEMLRPDPPRSAIPDAHAIPTMADDDGEAALSMAIPSQPELPAAAWSTAARGTDVAKPLVPWTDPSMRAIVDPDLATIVKPLPKEEVTLPSRTDPTVSAVPPPPPPQTDEIKPVAAGVLPPPPASIRTSTPQPAAAADAVAPVDSPAAVVAPAPSVASDAPRMAPLDRVVEGSTASGELEDPLAAAIQANVWKRVAIGAAITVPVIVGVIALALFASRARSSSETTPQPRAVVDAKPVAIAHADEVAPRTQPATKTEAPAHHAERTVASEPTHAAEVAPSPETTTAKFVTTAPATASTATTSTKSAKSKHARGSSAASSSEPSESKRATPAAKAEKSEETPKPAELKSELKHLF